MRCDVIFRTPLATVAALVVGASLSLGPEVAGFDQWTNLTGTRTVNAEFVGMFNGRVLLKLEDGRRVSVKMDDLIAESRIQAEQRHEALVERIQQRRDELQAAAGVAAAPAPEEKLTFDDPPAYRPVEPGADLVSTLQGIASQLSSGHIRVLYDTLPESQQKQLDRWFAAAMAKLDADAFETARQALAQWGELNVSYQQWLISHPQVGPMYNDDVRQLVAQGELLRRLCAEQVSGVETLRSRSLGESLQVISDALAPILHQLVIDSGVDLPTLVSDLKTEQLPSGATRAQLEFFGQAIPLGEFFPAENRWMIAIKPEDADKQWEAWIAALADIPDGSLGPPSELAAAVAQLQQITTALAAADDRQGFHRKLDDLIPEIMAQAGQTMQQVAGMPQPGRGMPGAMGAGDQYEMEMEMMDDYGEEGYDDGSSAGPMSSEAMMRSPQSGAPAAAGSSSGGAVP